MSLRSSDDSNPTAQESGNNRLVRGVVCLEDNKHFSLV